MYRRLAKKSSGVNSKLMRRLYLAVAVPKLTYAADVWYTPIHLAEGLTKRCESVGVTKQLARVGTLAICGAMRTTATDTLDLHANLLPTELLLPPRRHAPRHATPQRPTPQTTAYQRQAICQKT
jgi:hypothetical protein